jgi:hypothetical protein
MASGDGARPPRPEDMVALLDPRGRVVWCLRPPRRVTRSWTCAVEARGVTLYRWPLRSHFVPLERVDRFDMLWEQHDDFGPPLERLALFTTDGERLRATGLLNALVSCRFGLPHAARALRLNNHIVAIRRAARPAGVVGMGDSRPDRDCRDAPTVGSAELLPERRPVSDVQRQEAQGAG